MVVAKKHHELHEQLRSIVGAKYVTDDYSILLTYTRDASVFPAGKPQGAVVRPGSVEEVVEIVRLANQTRTPIIPMGGKASICGVPPGQPGRGIIVDMRRMSKVIDIDERNHAVTAQCGITLGELDSKCNERGFNINTAALPHYIDTIGGHISGIPGAGFARYGHSMGFNWHAVIGMKVVLPNGSVVDTGTGEGSLSTYQGHTWARCMHGPDFGGIFIGDGGIYGIKVEATYRMFRLPKFQYGSARCWDLDSLDQVYQALDELWETDPYLYMQRLASGMILSPEVLPLFDPTAEPAWLLFFMNVGETQEEVDLKFKITDEICAKHGGKPADPSVVNVTNGFIDAVQDTGRMATYGQFPLMELMVSRRDILEAYKWSREFYFNALAKRGMDRNAIPIISVLLFAEPGHGMTSVTPMIDQSDRELVKMIHEFMVEFLEQAMRRGYVPEATQGHESRLKARQWTPEFYNFALTLKKTLDPNNIMNPGVFFP